MTWCAYRKSSSTDAARASSSGRTIRSSMRRHSALPAQLIRNADDLVPVLKKAFNTPGPVIVGVHVDYRDNHSSSRWSTRQPLIEGATFEALSWCSFIGGIRPERRYASSWMWELKFVTDVEFDCIVEPRKMVLMLYRDSTRPVRHRAEVAILSSYKLTSECQRHKDEVNDREYYQANRT
jgi:Thiamine pyrophosphate-requiring enzymes [acetolactate synthase, pyruvate dehydrogenase (cytochrome), glyoxylate carboligase, phosphonopyruvate decarboxylase]